MSVKIDKAPAIREEYFLDDFWGYGYEYYTWSRILTGSGTGTTISGLGGQFEFGNSGGAGIGTSLLQFISGATATGSNFAPENQMSMRVRVKIPAVSFLAAQIGFRNDSTHYVCWWFDFSGVAPSPNWWTRTNNGGAITDTDTGVAATTAWHTLDLIGDGAPGIEFLLDDTVYDNRVTANVPPLGTHYGPYIYYDSVTDDASSLLLDYVEIVGLK
jgi:hypothetical protein